MKTTPSPLTLAAAAVLALASGAARWLAQLGAF